jgi:rubrerythrin
LRKILIVSALTIVSSISTAALGGETLSNSSRQDLLDAMKNDAFAYLKYRMLSGQVRKNGNQPLAGILEHIATDEHEKHFKEHAKLCGLLKIDPENVVHAKSAKIVESIQMYQDMARAECAKSESVAAQF